ncbi:putative fused malic enzyme oxidoreductase; phosphotransacetylase [Bradyrhizobium sp. ORS 375]|uniref:NADP-dependent malic enzyme n=1 Tax=Bradyrhizobium sp. (strain ORS 375) TaxID=566679 RepID=UPI0002409B73|nr:NADP-dependent malic enzyme [Bradyrhizobium sp. ORS 375]CCD91049.1 putative fused malic enzyme oxidoreductase; phosphotransacetylase [Bradyrhizobium sp. ORS 375]
MDRDLKDAALEYHRLPRPGKISVVPTKAMATQRDLALAYSPGVAEPCLVIAADPAQADELTARSNLVAVITNGTAVLGLGNIGPLAGKPVMEGKACLFKKFAGIDVFDIELAETDPDALIETIARMEPTFGGINLEDIKAPECFSIEQKLRERMKIPVFHDDQHGTAIIVAAAILNGLKLVKKDISQVRLVCSGAGAAALACLDLIVSLGLPRERIIVSDVFGVVHAGRAEGMDDNKARYAVETSARTLGDIIEGADIFLGLSAGNVLKPDMVQRMARDPLIFAMANPTPEIMPQDALAVRPDAIIGTGRSDFPNQINNVLCFPFIFRGALDCGATTINDAMKLATVRALADLAMTEVPEVVAAAYKGEGLRFGRDYLIPKPFDPRLIEVIAPAVAKAAADTGVARRPIADMAEYRAKLARFVYRSGNAMQPVFAVAKSAAKSLLLAEGEEERVLRAAQIIVDEGLALPKLVGRSAVIEEQIKTFGLRLKPGRDCAIIDPQDEHVHAECAELYHARRKRDGVSAGLALSETRNNATVLASLLLARGDGDAMLCGVVGRTSDHLTTIRNVIGLRDDVATLAVMQMLILERHQLFICDTHCNADPSAEQVADIALLAATAVSRFGITPRVALLSHSSFGSSAAPEAQKMRRARAIIHERSPALIVEGEMRGDAALSQSILDHEFPDSRFDGPANVLVMPNRDAANISYNLLRMAAGQGLTVGGILLGAAKPAHILTPSSTVRRIVNMAAVAVAGTSVTLAT